MEMSLTEIFLQSLNYLLMFGILLTIVMIIKYGFDLMNSRGNPSAFEETKKGIKNTLMGLGVLLLSSVLLGTINPELTKIDFSFEKIDIDYIFNHTEEIKEETNLDSFVFEEIPIGTIVENLLAGTSSIEIPCYEYDDLGNTIDQNNDQNIDDKDVLLGVDILYCVENLLEAYHKKIENHLVPLVGELYQLISTECTCAHCYTGYYKTDLYKPNNWGETPLPPDSCDYSICEEVYDGSDCYTTEEGEETCSDRYHTECTSHTCTKTCTDPFSRCEHCCGGPNGCSDSPSNPFKTLNQYEYDPCHNRKDIKCKEQEIEQFMTGKSPDDTCNISSLSPLVLTFSDAMERLEVFKSFYGNTLNDLSNAKSKMKIPWGSRISLAEFNKVENEISSYKIEKESFLNYDISKYCRNFNLNNNNTTCKIIEGEEQYSYDGDAATFYFSKKYNDYVEQYSLPSNNSYECSILEGDISKGLYSGVIPIGEAVEFAEDWAIEVSSRINNVQDVGNHIKSEIENKIYNFSTTCECSKCQSGNLGKYWDTTLGTCDEACLCPSYTFFPCLACVPNNSYGVCSYQDFRNVVKNLFGQNYELDNVCFISSDDDSEKQIRENNISLMSSLQKSKGYSSMKDIGGFKIVSESRLQTITDLFETIEFPEDLLPIDQSCNNDLNSEENDRFEVLEKLTIARKKLTGCVNGYSSPYKDNNSERTEVFSCIEGLIETSFTILPGFPYPIGNNYINCFPYNSDLLTTEEKEECIYNPLREGTENNKGCLLITENIMDNYYCCE